MPGTSWHGQLPRRMVPPLPQITFCSGMMSMTGWAVPASNSVELARACDMHVAAELDDHDLQSQAQAEIGHLVDPGVFGGLDHALDAAVTEAAGHDDALGVVQQPLTAGFVQVFGLDPVYLNLAAVMDAGVGQSLTDRVVSIS